MSPDELRRKAQQRQRQDRSGVISTTIICLIFSAIFSWWFVTAPERVARLGWGPLSLWAFRFGCSLLTLWCLYTPYQVYKWTWPGRLAPDATLNTTLQFYRSRIEKRRDFHRYLFGRLVPFFILGIAMVLVPPLMVVVAAGYPWLAVVGFCVVAAPLWAILSPLRKRVERELEQEIEELCVFEGEHRL